MSGTGPPHHAYIRSRERPPTCRGTPSFRCLQHHRVPCLFVCLSALAPVITVSGPDRLRKSCPNNSGRKNRNPHGVISACEETEGRGEMKKRDPYGPLSDDPERGLSCVDGRYLPPYTLATFCLRVPPYSVLSVLLAGRPRPPFVRAAGAFYILLPSVCVWTNTVSITTSLCRRLRRGHNNGPSLFIYGELPSALLPGPKGRLPGFRMNGMHDVPSD